jgi:phosphonoacetate hydrolase
MPTRPQLQVPGIRVIPSFTNPNNLSIVTGAPPAVHGICGNYFFDRDKRRGSVDERSEVPACADHLRGLPDGRRQGRGGDRQGQAQAAARQQAQVRRHGGQLLFGKADQCTLADHGIEDVLDLVAMPLPDVYSLELSEFVFAAGVKLLQRFKPDLMYLSTTDYIQHKFAPGTDGANAFYAMMDRYLGELDRPVR